MAEEHITSITMKNGEVKCVFMGFYIKEEDGVYSWFIPAFDMYYSTNTLNEGPIVGRAMTKSFFIYWLEKEKNFSQLVREITKMGFKAIDHRNTVNKLLRGKAHRATFSSRVQLPVDFANSKKADMNLEFA